MVDTKMEKRIATRIPDDLLQHMEQDMQEKHYHTYSDYIRTAIREKLEKEA